SRRKMVDHLARRIPSCDALGVSREDGKSAIPSRRQLTPLHQVDLGCELGMFRSVGCEQFGPTAAGLRAAGADSRGEAGAHGLGNQELGVLGPAVVAFGEANLLLTQRLAVSR